VARLTALLGSPRNGGNTDTLLEKALDAARASGAQIDKIVLNDLNIRPCQECGGCLEKGLCVIKDDMAVVYKALEEADNVLVASPIFFANVSAQTKTMIDRMQCFWVRKYLLHKKKNSKKRSGTFIACGGFKKKSFFNCAEKVIDAFFKVQDIDYIEGFFAGGVDAIGDILKQEKMLKRAYDLGKKLVEP